VAGAHLHSVTINMGIESSKPSAGS